MNQSETNPLATALAALMTGHNANPNTSLRIPLVDSNGNLQPGPTLAELASVLGTTVLFSGGGEQSYPNIDDLKYGCFYTGSSNTINGTWSGFPTGILNSGNIQICIIAISANWGNGARGFQIAFSRLGMAIRYNSGTWGAWTERLWNKWPNE